MARSNEQYFTPFFRLVELVSWALVILSLVYTIDRIPSLPAEVPTHFGFNGHPDSYGPPWTYALMPVIMLVCLALVSGFVHFLPTRFWNAPPKFSGSSNFRWYRTSVGVSVLCEFELSVFTFLLQYLLVTGQTHFIAPASIALVVAMLGSVGVVTWRGIRT